MRTITIHRPSEHANQVDEMPSWRPACLGGAHSCGRWYTRQPSGRLLGRVEPPQRTVLSLLLLGMIFIAPLSADPPAVEVAKSHAPAEVQRLQQALGKEVAVAVARDGRIHLRYSQRVGQPTVQLPRLNCPVVTVEGGSVGGPTTPWKLTPEVDHWEVSIPEAVKGPVELWLALATPLALPSPDQYQAPNQQGIVQLPAHVGIVHGKMLRYEPQPHKNTIGYWVEADDFVTWNFRAPPGDYDVVVRQGCGAGHGGSDVVFHVNDVQLPFRVVETGGFQTWQEVPVGTVHLAQSEQSVLEVRVRRIAQGAVMDIQRIELHPRQNP